MGRKRKLVSGTAWEMLRQLQAEWGRIGGKKRWKRLSREERSAAMREVRRKGLARKAEGELTIPPLT